MRREGFELTVGKPVVIPRTIDGVLHEPVDRVSVKFKTAEQVGLVRHHDLGRGGRGPGLTIGDQVGERSVGRVAQRGDDRDPHRLDGAHHGLLVERHQLFEAAAAASDDDDVGQPILVALP